MWVRIYGKRQLLERLLIAGVGKDFLCEYLGQGADKLDLNKPGDKENRVKSGRRCNVL